MSLNDPRECFNAALAHHRAGRLGEAEVIYREIMAQDSSHVGALHYLGVIAFQVGRLEVAAALMQHALQFAPANPELLSNLGEVYRRRGQADEAFACFSRAVEIAPNFSDPHNNLGALLVTQNRIADAIPYFRAAVTANPAAFGARVNLASALFNVQAFDDAVGHYERALELAPPEAGLLTDFGCALEAAGRLDDAVARFEAALRNDPNFARAHRCLGYVRFHLGQVEASAESLQRALELEPTDAAGHSGLLLVLNCHPDYGPEQIAAEQVRWRERHVAHLPRFREFPNGRETGRRLRIGYVSPDFRGHALGFNLLPLFKQHSGTGVEIHCYAEIRKPDIVTEEFRRHAQVWCETNGLSDEQVADRIRADRIDILVDLTLHSPNHRLGVFARKPAPVQVTFAGYPGSTGLDTIDYRLSDPWIDPVGMSERHYSEETWRLPHSFWCFEAFDENEVGPLPAAHNGYVTFGSLNTFGKVNGRVLSLWARVLGAAPQSRLHLMAPPGSARMRALEILAQAGVDPGRVTFFGRQPRNEYFKTYQGIDIGLDPFPYNGHTTSLDSLWMGVPVVTLVGQTVVGRAGVSQLSNLGLTDLIAHDPDEFVRIAVALTHDHSRLAELRRTLRGRMQASPLTDAAGFARGVETAYRSMWRTWCEAGGGRTSVS